MYIVKHKYLPFIMSACIVLVDQAVKSFVVKRWPLPGTLIANYFGGFLQFYHVRNRAIAFSLGHDLPEAARPILFVVVPLVVLGFLVWYYFRAPEFGGLQRWAVAGIIGGGLGNILDRIFRPDGVVDIVSVKFYGLFGMERWPTFNIADSCVVVSCFILMATIIVSPSDKPDPKSQKSEAAP